MLNIASQPVEVNVEIGPNDSYWMGSSGLSDANATYLSAVLVLTYIAWMVWKNWDHIDRD
jgi:hypothetical protein